MKELENSDASISDMYSFSQAIASGKTVDQQLSEDEQAASKLKVL